MRRMLSLHLLVVGLLALFIVSPAYAAPPANDDIGNAVPITNLPFTDTQDTREATDSSDDPADCGSYGSVWYTFTPSSDAPLRADTFGSDYDTVISIYTGAPDVAVACGYGSPVFFNAQAGVTYYFRVGAYCCEGAGGNLIFNVTDTSNIEPLTLTATINSGGMVNKQTGFVTLTGTITCSRPAFVDISATLRQRVSRTVVVTGSGYKGIECDGTVPWSVTVESGNGPLAFLNGKVAAEVYASAYDVELDTYVDTRASSAVTLRWGK